MGATSASSWSSRSSATRESERGTRESAAWRERDVVVHCHHGGRSEKACRLLAANGFQRTSSLDGGIEAWALTVDPDTPRY